MKAIIFGANGQDGHYLSEHCKTAGMQVLRVSRSAGEVHLDVADRSAVTELIGQHKPDFIFHLAANSTTAHSAGFENHATICDGSLNLLEAVYQHHRPAKVFITGSGVQFKNTGSPISETDEFMANSPYAVSRIHSVFAARYYRSLGVRAYVGYLFHHESPFRKPHHISKKIVDATRRISAGSDEVLELGDVSVRKEWTFAGDIASAILRLIRQDEIFEASIGSGEAFSIREWLDQCFGLIDRDWNDFVRSKSNFSPEYKTLVSNPATIKSLGWSQTVNFPQLAKMMMHTK